MSGRTDGPADGWADGPAGRPVADALERRGVAVARTARPQHRGKRAKAGDDPARRRQLAAMRLAWQARRRQYDRLGPIVCMAADIGNLLAVDVQQQPDGQPAVVRVTGEIDISSSPLLHGCLSTLLAVGVPVVLDVAAVTFMDASGVAVLVEARDMAAAKGASFVVRHPTDAVSRVLRITGAVRTLAIDDTRARGT